MEGATVLPSGAYKLLPKACPLVESAHIVFGRDQRYCRNALSAFKLYEQLKFLVIRGIQERDLIYLLHLVGQNLESLCIENVGLFVRNQKEHYMMLCPKLKHFRFISCDEYSPKGWGNIAKDVENMVKEWNSRQNAPL